jgi:HAD superfamily hydrolase (TIGR01509 family)
MKQIAVVFDMDGLMVDTEPLSRQAWAHVLQAYGYELEDELYRRMIGRRTEESVQFVLSAIDISVTATELVRRKREVFDGIRAKGVPVMPGLMELQSAIARRGLPWAVATSSPRYHAELILAQLGLATACRAIAAGDEVERGKPAPDIYLLAAERLELPSSQCLALEDSEPGCRAAVAAGMVTVAVPGVETMRDDFSFVYRVYDSLHQVADNLDTLLAALPAS